MKTLQEVVAGDEVVYDFRHDGLIIFKVQRVTKSQIFINHGLHVGAYWKKDGYEVGGSGGFWRKKIYILEPERMKSIKDDNLRKSCIRDITEAAKSITLEQAVDSLAVVRGARLSELLSVATACLEYIDAIPVEITKDMPGFDRDRANGTIETAKSALAEAKS